MSEISATDAALGGFGLARSNPRTVLMWGLLAFISTITTFALMTVLSGPAFAEAQTMGVSGDVDPGQILEMYRQMAPGYGASIAVSIVISGLLNASAARLVLNPSDTGGFGYVQFGADELRQMLLALVLNLIFIGVWVAVIVLASLAYLVGGPGLSALVGLVGFLAALVASLLLVVRLSLSSSATFVQRRLAIGESWRLTKGRYWPLLGTYLLAGVLGMLVILLVWGIAMVVITLVFGLAAAGGAMSPTFSSLGAVFSPASLIYFAILSFGSSLGYLIMLTPAPSIYRQLTGAPAVFD
ncbi:hypothetical protein [Caulobacter sp. NIBR1757]|uniref:hypothetical protein n=1 Tax=Caulobacter sp. NIBR1757 TaxID=3016000 RepID=UPI0022F11903|nr:hypothetical protein [Caulobacter sp. NIBR1757]WGM39872.1 hypothetical protein AMEJIAPC_02812 [Caulobacter sp. NIBR1757]